MVAPIAGVAGSSPDAPDHKYLAKKPRCTRQGSVRTEESGARLEIACCVSIFDLEFSRADEHMAQHPPATTVPPRPATPGVIPRYPGGEALRATPAAAVPGRTPWTDPRSAPLQVP